MGHELFTNILLTKKCKTPADNSIQRLALFTFCVRRKKGFAFETFVYYGNSIHFLKVIKHFEINTIYTHLF